MMQVENNILTEHWFLSNEQTFKGPFNDVKIIQMIQQGEVQKTDRLWSRRQNDWLQISEIPIFADIQSLQEHATKSKTDSNDWNNSDQFWSYIQSRHQNLNNQSFLPTARKKKHRTISKGRALSTGFLVSALIGLFVFQNLNSNYQNISLNLKDNEIAREVISQSYSKFGARFSLFQNSKEKMIVATNLENGSEVQVRLEGIPDTLVGVFQSQHEKNVIVEDGYFKINLLTQNGNQSFSEGEYNLKFYCLKCNSGVQDKALAVFEQKIFLGLNRDEAYDLRLSQYHTKLREQAKNELQEFQQLSESLIAQVQSLSVDRWDIRAQQQWLSRHQGWRSLQDQLSSELNHLSNSKNEGTVYYAELVDTLFVADDKIKQLEFDFIESMKLQTNSERVLKRIELNKRGSDIVEHLNTVKQRVSYFMNRPLTSSGMPRNK
jgi:GYF domain 2